MRKVIQISAAGCANTTNTRTDVAVFALCDDGTIWGAVGGAWQDWGAPPAGTTDEFTFEQAIREIAQEAHSMGRLYSESDERELPAVEFQRVAAMVTRKLEEAKR